MQYVFILIYCRGMNYAPFASASDMSLAKPTWTSKARAEEFAYMRNAAGNLRGLAERCVNATPNEDYIMFVMSSSLN